MKITENDRERIFIFRRVLEENNDIESPLFKLKNCTDNELLDILNSTVLANSISLNVFRYSSLFNILISKNAIARKKVSDSFKKIEELASLMSSSEKDLLKFGLFSGLTIYNWRLQLKRYSSNSCDLDITPLKTSKKISSYNFSRIFPFIYSIISKGEKNEKFPRF